MGAFFEKPIQWWMIGAFYGSPPFDSHYPHFLYHSEIYRSRLAVAGGLSKAIANVALQGGHECVSVTLRLSPWLIFCIPAVCLLWTLTRQCSPARSDSGNVVSLCDNRLLLLLFLGLGEGGQMRYWLVPITLLIVLGTTGRPGTLSKLESRRCHMGAGKTWILALIFVLVFGVRYWRCSLPRSL